MLIDAEIELFQRLLFCGAFAVDADARIGIGLLLALLLEILPRGNAARLEILHKIPQRRP